MRIIIASVAAALQIFWTGVASASWFCDPYAPGLQAGAMTNSDDEGCVTGGDSITPVTNEASFSAAGGQAGHAFAMAAYGVNAASVTGNLPDGLSGVTDANARSIWADTLTITGGTGIDVGIIRTHISGSLTDHIEAGLRVSIDNGAGGNADWIVRFGANPNPGETTYISEDLDLNFAFIYDVPFSLSSTLGLLGHLDSLCCGGPAGQPPFSADFSHTAAVSAVILPLGATLNSTSEKSYPVHEPGWLFGDGFEPGNLLGWSASVP